MTRDEAVTAAAQYLDDGRFLADLSRRVTWHTESDLGKAPPELHAYLAQEMVPTLDALGFECRIVDNPVKGGFPFLIARRIESAELPTVLTYGHGDVVNGQDAQWRAGLTPWQVTVEGDRFYGRGTADNKGQHTVNIGALAEVIRARGGKLGYNVTVLFEMGEEAGSPDLQQVCEQEREALRADLLIACDGPRVSAARPTLFLGSRGAVNFSLRLKSRDRAFHSGNWGGVLVNPGTRIAHAVATLMDARGRMLVEGLRPPPLTDAVRKALADIEFGGGEDDPTMDDTWGEPGLSAGERLVGWNTLEVLALGGGNAERPINAIPREAVAHCQLRFVVGTPWENLQSIVQQHLAERGFDDIEVTVTMTGAATRLDVDHPWVDWARESIKRSTGQAPAVLPNLAGSLPNDVFATTLGLPTLWVPHSYPACGQHAPNEHMLVSIADQGLRMMAGLYWDLSEDISTPWHQTAPRLP